MMILLKHLYFIKHIENKVEKIDFYNSNIF